MAPCYRVPLIAEERARDRGVADLLPYRSGPASDHKTDRDSLRFRRSGGDALPLTFAEIGQHIPSGLWYFSAASSTEGLTGSEERKAVLAPDCAESN